jgi:uncharacterized protein (DUF488 family)
LQEHVKKMMSESARGTVLTVGHSNRDLDTFIGLLKAHGITRLVDVRTVPRSRHNPQFNRDALPDSLAAVGIAYTHMPGLGGLRKPKPESINSGWRNASFQGFADYMQTPEFAENIRALEDLAQRDRAAIMCAEAVPWRCHRSLVADALTVRGWRVEHIMSETKRQDHKLTPFAHVEGTQITYPQQPSLPFPADDGT